MKKHNNLKIIWLIGMLTIVSLKLFSQESPQFRRTAFSFNVTRCLVSELNMSMEFFKTSRKSIEFNGGLIYVNSFLEERAKDWNNTTLFSEHGYAGRIYYKIFKRPDDKSKWRDYIAPGVSYKHLYYNEQWFDNNKSDDTLLRLNQKRDRNKIGLEFLWGKVYEASQGFAIEFYYGAGISLNSVTRTISQAQIKHNSEIINYNSTIKSFYARPTLLVGCKIRFRL